MTKKKILPEVTLSEDGELRYLHLGSIWVQGSMWIDKPFDLHLEYIQRMMAGLLFLPEASLKKGHAMQLGLGSAALTKFTHKRLRWRTTAVEINSQVVAVCRQFFKLAPNDTRLSVKLNDAAAEIKLDEHLGKVDLLHVDLYDHTADAPVLDTQVFYRHCFHALSDGGVMAVNLFGRLASFETSVARIEAAFGQGNTVRIFKPTREGNQVVLAQRNPIDWSREALAARADTIEAAYALPAKKWLKNFSKR